MSEEWTRWEPIPGLEDKYYVESISDTFAELKIVLSSYKTNQKVIVSCENSVYAYRTTYESFRMKVIHELHEKYGIDFYGDWTFFKVHNSSYLKWLSKESYTLTDCLQFTHYALVAGESILDIINGSDPKVEIIQLP